MSPSIAYRAPERPLHRPGIPRGRRTCRRQSATGHERDQARTGAGVKTRDEYRREEQDKRRACPRQRREQNTQRKRGHDRAERDEITRNGVSRQMIGLIAHRRPGDSSRAGAECAQACDVIVSRSGREPAAQGTRRARAHKEWPAATSMGRRADSMNSSQVGQTTSRVAISRHAGRFLADRRRPVSVRKTFRGLQTTMACHSTRGPLDCDDCIDSCVGVSDCPRRPGVYRCPPLETVEAQPR